MLTRETEMATLLIMVVLASAANSQTCVYPQYDLDLSPLMGNILQCIDNQGAPYILTPCESSQRCGNFDIDSYMIIQLRTLTKYILFRCFNQ